MGLHLLDEASGLVVEESMLLRAQCSGRSLESADVVVGRHWHLRIWCACAIDVNFGSAVGERRWSAHVGCTLVVFCKPVLACVVDQDRAGIRIGLELKAGYQISA